MKTPTQILQEVLIIFQEKKNLKTITAEDIKTLEQAEQIIHAEIKEFYSGWRKQGGRK